MTRFALYLTSIADRAEPLLAQLIGWAHINSGSFHAAGLARMAEALTAAFAPLAETHDGIPLPPMTRVNAAGEAEQVPLAPVLRFATRPTAPLQILLVGHYDTVYGADHPFQTCTLRPDGTLNGPGVADLKGGLVVMHEALRVLESSPWRDRIGWEVLLNPDEEIGSPGSAAVLAAAAPRFHLGLDVEPAMPDGALAAARKGSGNFTWVVRGRAAHAGRDIDAGRNAIVALAELTAKLAALHQPHGGISVNPGVISGGSVVNMVPELAMLRFNIRMQTPEQLAGIEPALHALEAEINAREGFSIVRHGGFSRPPKPMTPALEALLGMVAECAAQLGQPLKWRDSGGVCDGNNLAAAGLVNVDTLGVIGGHLHSPDEYMLVSSLTERAQLLALLLLRLASGELAPPSHP